MEIILQKQRSRNYNGRNHYRYRVTIPSRIASDLDLEGGEKLEVRAICGAILITRAGW